MIRNFVDERLQDVYLARSTKHAAKIPKALWKRIRLKLDAMQAAERLDDLRVPPSNHLEKLKGELEGLYSIRVNEQFRIVFGFEGGYATDVRFMDYHK
jgi:proteic killer suppression protein